jgi:hypothetical protein
VRAAILQSNFVGAKVTDWRQKRDIWIMSYPVKEIARNIFSICFGVFSSVGIFSCLFLATALLPQTINSTDFLMILLGLAAFAGGFFTAMMATRHKFILSCICTMLLVVVYIHFFDVNFIDRNAPGEILQITIIFIMSIIGGIAGTLPSRKTNKGN